MVVVVVVVVDTVSVEEEEPEPDDPGMTDGDGRVVVVDFSSCVGWGERT